MPRPVLALALLGAFVERGALAAEPSTAECLAASEASLTLATAHKLRDERAKLIVCAAASCPADVRAECLRRVTEVSADLPTIVFGAKGPSGADLTEVTVMMDGAPLAAKLDGVALPVDPGEHTFRFETAGQPPLEKRLFVVEGQRDRHEVLVFGGDAQPAAAPVASPLDPAPSEVAGGWGGQRVLAVVVGGAALVGIGVGAGFGVAAISAKNAAHALCPADCATSAGVSKWSDAATAGNVSTVAFVAGGVAAVGAAVLWFTAPSGAGGTRVGFGPGAVTVAGSF